MTSGRTHEPIRITFPALDAYGDGGFRIAEQRHEGAVLIVNGSVSAWSVATLGDVTASTLETVFQAAPRPEFLLLGVGARMARPPARLSDDLRSAGMGLEFMATPAACRAYVALVGEGRHLATALLPVP